MAASGSTYESNWPTDWLYWSWLRQIWSSWKGMFLCTMKSDCILFCQVTLTRITQRDVLIFALPFLSDTTFLSGVAKGGRPPRVSPFWGDTISWHQSNEKNKKTMCLTSSEMSSTLEWTKKWFKSIFWNIYVEGGGALICQKYKSQISVNFEKYLILSNQIWSLVDTCWISNQIF